MLTIKLLLLLALVHSSSSNLPEECLPSGPGPPANRTRVMLGYLTDVTGMPGRQVRASAWSRVRLTYSGTRQFRVRLLLRTQEIMSQLSLMAIKHKLNLNTAKTSQLMRLLALL